MRVTFIFHPWFSSNLFLIICMQNQFIIFMDKTLWVYDRDQNEKGRGLIKWVGILCLKGGDLMLISASGLKISLSASVLRLLDDAGAPSAGIRIPRRPRS